MTLLLGLAGEASAQGPAFDCGTPRGDVETLICKDAGLAALDRTLDVVYKAAMSKARDDMSAQVRAEQRGLALRDLARRDAAVSGPLRATARLALSS